MPPPGTPSVIVAHPSPDLYGSDLQLLETITGFRAAGWDVTVVLPRSGPLVPRLRECGADVRLVPFPVLSKSLLAPKRLPGLVVSSLRALRAIRRGLVERQPDAVWVNTLTEPVWVLAARLAGVPAVCHVHEAEEDQPWPLRAGLSTPLLLTRAIAVNSGAARRALTSVIPWLQERVELVYNGMDGPPAGATPRRARAGADPLRVGLVGRLSPRKGTDVALDAVGLLREAGLDVHLDLYGTVFPGYEWYEQELRDRADRPDLVGAVTFHGYVNPVWDALTDADAMVVPSRSEPFGNVAVEAMLAGRPVVASNVQGLAEIVRDDETGLLVEPGDAAALAGALRRLYDDPALAERLVDAGLADAPARFGAERYRTEITAVLDRSVRGDRG